MGSWADEGLQVTGGRTGLLARLDAHDLLPLVRTGVVWTNGYRVEQTEPRTERKAGTVGLITFNPQLLTYLEDWSWGA